MKRITTTLALALLIGGFFTPTRSLAQQSESAEKSEAAKAPKLTLKSVEAQVTALQAAVAAQQPNFAVVRSDATLARGSSSAISVARPSAAPIGRYNVTFNRDVSGCGYIATLGDTDAGVETPGTISVATSDIDSHAVFVQTTDLTGARSDRDFHLSVSCP